MIEIIKRFEGLRLTAYLDGGGVPTIGYGHTSGVRMGDTCTIEQAEQWLQEDAQDALQAIIDLVDVPLTPNQQEALASLVYNIGVGAFAKSTLLRLLNAGDYARAANQFDVWCHDNGQVVPGLVNRRAAEKRIFLGEKPVLPFIAAALPALLQAAPALIRIFGGGEQSEKNAQAAEKVVEIAKSVTGERTSEGAATKIQADPAMAQAFAEEARKQFLAIEALADKRVDAARVFNASESPLFGQWKFVHLLSVALIIFSGVGGILVVLGDFPGEIKGSVITLMLIGGWTAVQAYWLGSSAGSDKKTDMAARDK